MTKTTSLLLATAALAAMIPSLASAQTQTDTQSTQAATAASGEQVGTILVTARKRSENVLNVPIAITAFSGQDLENRQIQTLADLANYTPSLTDDLASAGGARVDRSTQLFNIRGLSPSNSLNPTTSVFLNGVPLGASDFLQNFDDIDHVEVLKGPQAAYFGRETFAGAINAVAKPAGFTPSVDGNFVAASRATFRISMSGTVPLIDDVLSIRVGGLYDSKDGSYQNAAAPGTTLGDQETKMGHLAITFKPAEGLTIKGFAAVFADNDGPAATGVLLASAGRFSQSNCNVNGTAFLCHTLPGLLGVSPAQETPLTVNEQNFVHNPGGIIPANQIVQGFGLKRLGSHYDVNADYLIPNTGLTLSYLGGVNYDNYSTITDLANLDGAATGQYPGYTGFPFLVETRNHDFSQEARLASDPTKRFHFLVGASYLKVYHEAINYNNFAAPAPVGAPSLSQTTGVFFSTGFDITPKLNLTAEGRYLWDTEIADNIQHVVVARGTSRNFAPRASLQYKPFHDTMVYATYSKGINPGVFNTQFNALPGLSQGELTATGAAGSLLVSPEKIDNYELGAKGRLLGGRMTVQGDIYYDRWNNQLQTNTFTFAANDPNNPYNVVGYAQYNPRNISVFIYSYQSNNASSTAKGIEGEMTLIPVRYFTLNASGSINDTKYRNFVCTSCVGFGTTPTTGFQAAGKRLPFSPEFQAAVGGMYQHPTTMFGATDFYGRVDYFYHSGIFTAATNLNKTQQSNTVNLRAGITFPMVTVEGFVNNVFNNRAYTTGFENYNFVTFSRAVMVGLPDLITGGVRVRMHF